jgi:hypothetical protein
MIDTAVCTRAVRRHVLDIATVLDWIQVSAPTRLLALAAVVQVTVEPPKLDGPLEAHMVLRWRMLGPARRRRQGRATLRMIAMATEPRAWTELTVLVSRPHGLGGRSLRWAREPTETFLTTLRRNLELALPMPTRS